MRDLCFGTAGKVQSARAAIKANIGAAFFEKVKGDAQATTSSSSNASYRDPLTVDQRKAKLYAMSTKKNAEDAVADTFNAFYLCEFLLACYYANKILKEKQAAEEARRAAIAEQAKQTRTGAPLPG